MDEDDAELDSWAYDDSFWGGHFDRAYKAAMAAYGRAYDIAADAEADVADARAELAAGTAQPDKLAAAQARQKLAEARLDAALSAASDALLPLAIRTMREADGERLVVPARQRVRVPADLPAGLLEQGADLWDQVQSVGVAVVTVPADSPLGLAIARVAVHEEAICKAACLVASAIFWRPGDSLGAPDVGTGQRRQADVDKVLAVLDGRMSDGDMLAALRSTAMLLDGTGARVLRAMSPAGGGFQLDLATAAAFKQAHASTAAAAALMELRDTYVGWVDATILALVKERSPHDTADLRAQPPKMLFGVPGDRMFVEGGAAVTSQAPHPDNPPECSVDELVSILNCSGGPVAVDAFAFSHELLRCLDKTPAEQEAAFIGMLDTRMARQLLLQPGQAVAFHPNTVHAGGAGIGQAWGLRLHTYFLRGPVGFGGEGGTPFLQHMGQCPETGPALADKFVGS